MPIRTATVDGTAKRKKTSHFGPPPDVLLLASRLQERAARFQRTLGTTVTQPVAKKARVRVSMNNILDEDGIIDWSKSSIHGTSTQLEKPYLRLTSVSKYISNVRQGVKHNGVSLRFIKERRAIGMVGCSAEMHHLFVCPLPLRLGAGSVYCAVTICPSTGSSAYN